MTQFIRRSVQMVNIQTDCELITIEKLDEHQDVKYPTVYRFPAGESTVWQKCRSFNLAGGLYEFSEHRWKNRTTWRLIGEHFPLENKFKAPKVICHEPIEIDQGVYRFNPVHTEIDNPNPDHRYDADPIMIHTGSNGIFDCWVYRDSITVMTGYGATPNPIDAE